MARKAQVIPVSKLLLDQSNARLGEVQPDQPSTVTALANKLGSQLVEIATDIVQYGLDPTISLAVTPEDAPDGKFRVIEGNRRLLALKSLKRPSILSETQLTSAIRKRISALAAEFSSNPVTSVSCVVFEREEDARHWIELRHTGANGGVGLVEWDSNEKDRYLSRHGARGKMRSAGGQVLDFVDRMQPLSSPSNNRIITTLQRLVADPAVREKLGIELTRGVVLSKYPAIEVLKGLRAVVEDFRTARKKVADVYHKEDRETYLQEFGPDRLPTRGTELATPVPLAELNVSSGSHQGNDSYGAANKSEEGSFRAQAPTDSSNGHDGDGNSTSANGPDNLSGASSEDPSDTKASRSRSKPISQRSTVIPSSCNLWITDGRVNAIYHELRKLDTNLYPNASAVTLRVFVELSIDHHLAANNLLDENQRRNLPLARKMKEVAAHLRSVGKIDQALERTVGRIADSATGMAGSVVTLHQYVHNRYSFPISTDIRAAWDEMQPFLMSVWER
ncbi:hypothetical protein [Amycolatopsis granulosa]|uniref:hypothetical protein n=1 Tax=Amycolatopsis granulosa TaxID=185684 RepID=UPI0014223AEA|nr:hypothetical protein [Amycolatopsis granulosa]NIH86600.1 hypothetical protein [Amycolatopsis granulosa]